MQYLAVLLLALTAHALHLPAQHQTQEVDTLYFQSEFADLTVEVEFVRRQIEGWQGQQTAFLLDRIAENKAGVQQLQRTLEKYQLFVNEVTPLCPGVSSFNRTEIRKYVVYLEEKQTAMVAAIQGCKNCQDLTTDILSLQNMTANYILRLNQTLDGQFCPPPAPLGESAKGMVNLNLSFFRCNLAAPNWYYGSTTASDYKIYLFRRSSTYNLTSCPLSRPFVQDTEQICFDCPAGGLFNLGSQKCDTCPSDAILNVKTGACQPCAGEKIAVNGSLICKECDWLQEIYLNATSGKCERCGNDSYVDKVSKNCIKINCPQRTPRFDRSTQKCVACPPSYVIDQTDKTKCIKTNFVGLCPPQTPHYNIVSHSCEPCPQGAAYNSEFNECTNQYGHMSTQSHAQVKPTMIVDSKYLNKQLSDLCKKNGTYINIENGQCVKCPNMIIPSAENFSYCLPNCVEPTPQFDKVTFFCNPCPQGFHYIYPFSFGRQCIRTTVCNSTQTLDRNSNTCLQTASTCLPIETYDPNTNKCHLICTKPTQTYDVSNKKCVQTASTCLKNETYIRKSNKCILSKSLCLKTQYYDESTFRCLSVSSSCKSSEFYDAELIKCVDRKSSCRGGEYYDEQRKKCVQDVVCGVDERFNFEIEACEKILILCREGKEYYDKDTKKCKAYEFITSPYVSNLIYSTPIQRYVEYYESAKSFNSKVKDCPPSTPFADPAKECIACPAATPYFDLADKKCLACANYDANSRRCIQLPSEIAELQRKRVRSQAMGRIPV